MARKIKEGKNEMLYLNEYLSMNKYLSVSTKLFITSQTRPLKLTKRHWVLMLDLNIKLLSLYDWLPDITIIVKHFPFLLVFFFFSSHIQHDISLMKFLTIYRISQISYIVILSLSWAKYRHSIESWVTHIVPPLLHNVKQFLL